MRKLLLALCCFSATTTIARDTTYLKVHFLYGSRPLKEYKDTEEKWFGGVLGGHVGIEADSNRIVNFLPQGSFHVFKKENDRHSTYAVHNESAFYGILGGDPDSVKKVIVYIPVTARQKQQFDSIAATYLVQTPYDYALFGMRCGAASYEILGQLNIVKKYPRKKTAKKIFYPKKLRKRLLKKAAPNGWTVVRQEGTPKRRWEKD
jgi:hypothetical protein